MRYVIIIFLIWFNFQTVSAQETKAETEVLAIPAIWQVCNETSFILRLATATDVNGSPAARGWETLRPGACQDLNIPVDTTRYIFAESSTAHQGGIREWKGSLDLCAGDTDFVANPDVTCALQDLKTRSFLSVQKEQIVTTLTEPDNFRSRAATAGIQRLLKDNGYDVSTIDGIEGRRTTQTLRKFLNDKGLATNLSFEEQIDALERAAKNHIPTVGLTTCNKSSQKIWVAIGRRHRDTWKSQGWWPVDIDSCIQPISEAINKQDIHVYARQDNEKNKDAPERLLRSVSTTPSQFCVSDARFSALGRDHCLDNGYDAANFRPLPVDKTGVTVTLTDNDFVEPNAVGLRQ